MSSARVRQVGKSVLQKLQEIDRVMTDLSRDLLDLKDEDLSPEEDTRLNQAIGRLGSVARDVQTAGDAIQQFMAPPEEQQAATMEERQPRPSELSRVAPLMVELGYSRDMSAPQNEVWYAHREGHQVRARPSGKSNLAWLYFPPRMLGETTKGMGIDGLQSHLAFVHRKTLRQQTNEGTDAVRPPEGPRSREAQSAFETPFKDFLIIQTQVEPVERYEVREAGHEYPRYIARFPRTGEWKDYTAEAMGSGTPPPRGTPSKYIDIVRFWINRGKPVLRSGGEPVDARSSGAVPQAMNAMGVTAQAGEGGYERSPSGDGSSPTAGVPDR